jgi:hypothetical protein
MGVWCRYVKRKQLVRCQNSQISAWELFCENTFLKKFFDFDSRNFCSVTTLPALQTHAMLFHRQLCSSNSHWCAFLISHLHAHISFVKNRFSLLQWDHSDLRLSPLMEKISSQCQPQICSRTTPFFESFRFLKGLVAHCHSFYLFLH